MAAKSEHTPTPFAQGASAVGYGVASIAIIAVNKAVLTSWGFPSAAFLGLSQLLFTICSLQLAKTLGFLTFPNMDSTIFRRVFPLPFLFLLNLITGLGGTQRINLPMFTVLRRFSIWFTMLLEQYILGTKQSTAVQISVFLMLGGALLAAANDLAFDMQGYTLILMNNLCTAANGVYVKKKLDAKDLGSFGLMFYNSLFALPVMAIFLFFNSEEMSQVALFEHWANNQFLFLFVVSSIMGVLLTYSIFLCTQLNSALTTTVVGCFKNVFVSYVGMFVGGDYVYDPYNFFGLNVSIAGSLVYAYYRFRQQGTAVM